LISKDNRVRPPDGQVVSVLCGSNPCQVNYSQWSGRARGDQQKEGAVGAIASSIAVRSYALF
jgi:hypothetical protein